MTKFVLLTLSENQVRICWSLEDKQRLKESAILSKID